MSKAKMVKVLIRVSRCTKYASIVEMEKSRYKDLLKRLDHKDRDVRQLAEEEANELINVDDWQDDRLDDLETFEEEK